jgi:deoxyribodipyrimidine photo-lyase
MKKTIESLTEDPRIFVRLGGSPNLEGNAVVYWMQRAQRAVDNPALETAVQAANLLRKPVVVFFGLSPQGRRANLRHFHFLVEGLVETADRLRRGGIGFVVRRQPNHCLLKFCEKVRPCLVIGDENPLRGAERRRQKVTVRLEAPFWTVDADVIVPSVLLEKEHYAARTIRPKIRDQLDQFLVPVGNTHVHVPWKALRSLYTLEPDTYLLEGLDIDRSVQPVSHLRGGTLHALRALKQFIGDALKGYARNRNHPELNETSQLSPYLHFGQISPHTVALAVQEADAPAVDKKAFLEELIVRRELAVNFVRFNPHYDSLESCEKWARRTLREHASDPRSYRYKEVSLENAETHDPLWNASQKQMVMTGWMHGYLRMYWAKKILQWTRSPEEALNICIRLNDRYELDGRDPNGYTGIAWAIGGKHDRAWGPERTVFGKIRYMSYESTSRKFDSKAYIQRIESLEKGSKG